MNNSVWPSAGAPVSSRNAGMKFSPGRFSTSMVVRRPSLIFCARRRAVTSAPLPAASPTTSLIGLAERSCASARQRGAATSIATTSATLALSRQAECNRAIMLPPASSSKKTGAGYGDPRQPLSAPFRSIGRRHDHDPRHHTSVLVLEDVAVIDELAQLGERDLLDDRRRGASAVAPLGNGANAVLVVADLIRDGWVGHGHAKREVVLDDVARVGPHLLDETRLLQVEVMVLG